MIQVHNTTYRAQFTSFSCVAITTHACQCLHSNSAIKHYYTPMSMPAQQLCYQALLHTHVNACTATLLSSTTTHPCQCLHSNSAIKHYYTPMSMPAQQLCYQALLHTHVNACTATLLSSMTASHILRDTNTTMHRKT